MSLKIVADQNIPRVREWFAPLGEVRMVAGRTLDASAVSDADILLVRSVTRVDAGLLAGSRVRFVGTATIGTDHLDLAWLAQRGIAVANAPGSNATSVVEYVLSALAAVDDVLERLLAGAQVGIVGLGNVGGRLLQRLQRLGIRVIGHDPLLPASSGLPLRALDEVLASAVVCLHTPLTREGPHPTRHLLGPAALARLRPGALLLNAGRGAVIDNRALAGILAQGRDLRTVLDVWEGEPAIDAGLLAAVTLGTPHIAGYSSDGKLAGTRMMLEACCRHLGVPVPLPAEPEPPLPLRLDPALRGADLLRAALLACYDVRADDRRLREAYAGGGVAAFDALRKDYPVRRELAAWAVVNWRDLDEEQRTLLTALGLSGGGSAGR